MFIICIVAALLGTSLFFVFRACGSESSLPNIPELSPTKTHDPQPSPSPLPTPSPTPELIIIDNTPAEEYVDIDAGAHNPANALPWAEAGERNLYDSNGFLVAMRYEEINLLHDGFIGFAWEEILAVEPDSFQIQDVPEDLVLPRRRIQCRDAARVVANEMIEGNQGSALKRIRHDPELNIWIFSFGPQPIIPSAWIVYVVNGYNSQVVRVVIDA